MCSCCKREKWWMKKTTAGNLRGRSECCVASPIHLNWSYIGEKILRHNKTRPSFSLFQQLQLLFCIYSSLQTLKISILLCTVEVYTSGMWEFFPAWHTECWSAYHQSSALGSLSVSKKLRKGGSRWQPKNSKTEHILPVGILSLSAKFWTANLSVVTI